MAVDRLLVNLDLNLLVTLDVLLRERNVTRAAERLGCSQPTASTSLARLRRHFDDELLYRAGGRYELTPIAVRLAARTGPAVESVRRVFDVRGAFDPATAAREFTILMSDYAVAVLGPVLTELVARAGPGMRLRLHQVTPHTVDHAPETLRAVDGILLPHGFVTGLPRTDLYQDRWVCVVARDNAAVGERLGLEQLRELPWVVLHDRPTAFAPPVRQLRMLGVEPRVEIVVDGFLQMPFLVAGGDRVALLPARLAHRVAPAAGLRVLDCPFDAFPLTEAFWWHPLYGGDAGHAWLRGILTEAAGALGAARPDRG